MRGVTRRKTSRSRIWSQKQTQPNGGPLLEGPEKFSHPESRSKISKLMITELFYSRIVNINKGSLHTRSFRRITSPFLDRDELKMALQASNVSGAFEKLVPESGTHWWVVNALTTAPSPLLPVARLDHYIPFSQ